MPSFHAARTTPVTPVPHAAQPLPDRAIPRITTPGSERISVQEAAARVKAWHAEHDPVMSAPQEGAREDGLHGQGREAH